MDNFDRKILHYCAFIFYCSHVFNFDIDINCLFIKLLSLYYF
jgi:hypothetical protein